VLQISAERLRPGIVRTLSLASAAVMPRLKYVIVVDDDIDIYNFSDVMWAVATRCDPKADIATVDGTMTSWLDPSSGGTDRQGVLRRHQEKRALAAKSRAIRSRPWSAPRN